MKSLIELLTYHQFMPYLIEASLILCVLYLPFEVLFKNERTFVLNRLYLIIIMAIVAILPISKIDFFPIFVENVRTNVINNATLQNTSTDSIISTINYLTLYYLGVIILLSSLLYQLLQIYLLIRRSPSLKDEGVTFTEKVTIVNSSISKVYKELIDAELKKKNPDFDMIQHWKTLGQK